MSEAAVEEVSVLSSIYCGEGEFLLVQQSAQDGLVVQINSTVGGERGLDVSLLFHLHPRYPSCPPNISVSSTALSRTQCHDIRQKLLDQAAASPPEPMVHQLVEWLQEFCRLLKTVKVDVDSSGKKCKERMMKVLTETLSSSSCGHGLQGFVVKNYQSLPELTAAFQEINMIELYQQILPSLSD